MIILAAVLAVVAVVTGAGLAEVCYPDLIPGQREEVTAWRKPARSLTNGECVEAGNGPGVVGVRDSKDPGGPVLRFTPAGWRAFLGRVRPGSEGKGPDELCLDCGQWGSCDCDDESEGETGAQTGHF